MIKTFLETLYQTKSTNAKKVLIEQNDSETIRKIYEYTYSPYVSYGIKKFPSVDTYGNEPIEIIFEILDKLIKREATGNAAQDLIKDTLARLSKDDQEVFKRVVLKNLKAGINASSINKALGEVVPTYPCLLAKNFTPKFGEKIAAPFYTQMKYDGCRINIHYDNGLVRFYSRSGKEFMIDVPHIKLDVEKLADELKRDSGLDSVSFVLDGEALVVADNGNPLDRATSNGLMNKGLKGTLDVEYMGAIRIYVWDYIPMVDFKAKTCDMLYEDRFMVVEKLQGDNVMPAENKVFYKLDEALEYCNTFISKGYEGGMIKPFDLLWADTRSNKLLKVKGNEDADLRVVGFEYGSPNSEFADGIGALVVETECGGLVMRVSSGLTHAQRGYIKDANNEWVIDPSFDFNQYNDQIITLNYACITKNTDGEYSLFTAKIIEFRNDKDTANSLSDLINN